MTYLDNAATSFPKPESVYTALDHFARHTLANPGRAGHKMALASEHALSDARHRLNRFFNGRNPDRWAFTLNCTDALNMAFKGVLNDGDHVVTTDLDDHQWAVVLESCDIEALDDGMLRHAVDAIRAAYGEQEIRALAENEPLLNVPDPAESIGSEPASIAMVRQGRIGFIELRSIYQVTAAETIRRTLWLQE